MTICPHPFINMLFLKKRDLSKNNDKRGFPMTAVTFNALTYFEELKSAGVPEQQAKVQADTLSQIVDEKIVTKDVLTKLATKEDLLATKAELKEEIGKVQISLIKWMIGLMAGLAALLISVMPLLKFAH